MDIMGPFRTHPATGNESVADDVRYVVVETDEDERLVFEGASQDELDAKLEDFLTWAS